MLECGQAIRVRDQSGTYVTQFIAQCGGRFIMISSPLSGDHRNGMMITDWHGVLRELVAQTQPAALREHTRMAESNTDAYHSVPLTWPLMVAELAGVLGVQAYEVRDQLAEYATPVE